jgi:predicted short-subunit dehydrogenase-like oxidoreductase (DUF2520 family)
MIKRVVLIGGGAVAESLGQRLADIGVLISVCCRDENRAAELSARWGVEYCNPTDVPQADLYIISVSDRAIEQVSRQLSVAPNSVVAHTAGSRAIEEITTEGAIRGVVYPLQTFSRGRNVDFREVPLMIEGEQRVDELMEFARRLSDNVVQSTFEMRRVLHLAGVFACNFVNRMYVAAQDIARIGGVDAKMLGPLILETARKAAEAESAELVQSGPAIRNDQETIDRHLTMLSEMAPYWTDVYELVTNKIRNGKL